MKRKKSYFGLTLNVIDNAFHMLEREGDTVTEIRCKGSECQKFKAWGKTVFGENYSDVFEIYGMLFTATVIVDESVPYDTMEIVGASGNIIEINYGNPIIRIINT
ncbi:MAG: hypothetical protein WC119_01315 [Synergistaceae bacterium]